MKVTMSRTKRFLNEYKERVNENGTLKNEYINQLKSSDFSEEDIANKAKKLKEEYEMNKTMDETEPESWQEYTAYDFFSSEEKKQFNPDGSFRSDYFEKAVKQGISRNYLDQLQYAKKLDIDKYNQMSEQWAERGINYGQWLMESWKSSSHNYINNLKQMKQDLANFEESSTLPFDVDTSY
jgi:hypothetical protein